MPKVEWIKLSVSMFDDEKIKLLEAMPDRDTLLIVWIRLLVLAGRTNDGGAIYLCEDIPYTDEMLATLFHRPLNVVRLALETFERFGMIERHQETIYLVNWEKYQNVVGLEEIRQKGAERARRYREKKKLSSSLKEELEEEGEREGNVTRHVTHEPTGLTMCTTRYQRLCSDYGKRVVDDYFERVLAYCDATGKSYKDNAATVENWLKRDKVKKAKKETVVSGVKDWRDGFGS